jgi:hypothetical protein
MASTAASNGVSIRIFLPDGNPEGIRLIFKANWTGIAVASPRSRYPEVRLARDELLRPGVYVLVGPAEQANFEGRVYVGEGEDLRARIDNHHANKDFWNRLVVFTSFGQALNKASIRYLEARLLERAANARRVELDNGTAPGLPPLAEPDAADAESFLRDMLLIFPILGINAFEPLQQTASGNRLHLTGPDAQGEGAETADGFIVFAGARARSETVPSFEQYAKGWATIRSSLIDAGTLVPIEGEDSLHLTEDQDFESPSAAAAILLGRNASGPIEWKDSAGRTLKQLREQTGQASPAIPGTTPTPGAPVADSAVGA